MKQLFISTPYGSYIGATTITAIKVEKEGSQYCVVISSEAEQDFCYATANLEVEAKTIAESLIESIGLLFRCE